MQVLIILNTSLLILRRWQDRIRTPRAFHLFIYPSILFIVLAINKVTQDVDFIFFPYPTHSLHPYFIVIFHIFVYPFYTVILRSLLRRIIKNRMRIVTRRFFSSSLFHRQKYFLHLIRCIFYSVIILRCRE